MRYEALSWRVWVRSQNLMTVLLLFQPYNSCRGDYKKYFYFHSVRRLDVKKKCEK